MATASISGAKPFDSAQVDDGDYAIVHWTLTTADPTGDSVAYPDYADRTVQFVSSAWGGATVELQGSLDGGTTWFTLTDPQGNAITATANGAEGVSEAVPLMRAKLTTVGVGATVNAYLFMRKSR